MLKGGSGQGSNNNQGNKNKNNNNNNNNANSNQKKEQFQGNCNYYGKFGHKEVDCHKKAANQKNGGNEAAAVAVSNGNHIEFLLCAKMEYGMMTTTKQVLPDLHKLLTQQTIWIGATVAMMDMTAYLVGMINKKEARESVSIVMGNKQAEKSVAIGDILCMVCDNLGNQVMGALIKDVALVPDCTFNLFSISKHLKQGWKLVGTEDTLILTSHNGKYIIKFDITMSMPNGKLYAICIMQTQEKVAGIMTTNDNLAKQVISMVQQVHDRLGHINERATKEIAKALGWKLTDATKLNCSSCAAGKVKQRSL